MVLPSQFNSFLHPVTVLTILPLAVAGAVIGLFRSVSYRSRRTREHR